VGSGGVEQRGHQVGSGGRRRADGGERRADGVGVPARLDGLKAADLLALERRVDAQIGSSSVSSWRWLLTPTTRRCPLSISVCRLKAASAIFALREVLLTAATIRRARRCAEVVVGLRLELVGQRLDEVRAAERVDRVRHPRPWAMICWVLSAIRTASSVGSASASS